MERRSEENSDRGYTPLFPLLEEVVSLPVEEAEAQMEEFLNGASPYEWFIQQMLDYPGPDHDIIHSLIAKNPNYLRGFRNLCLSSAVDFYCLQKQAASKVSNLPQS